MKKEVEYKVTLVLKPKSFKVYVMASDFKTAIFRAKKKVMEKPVVKSWFANGKTEFSKVKLRGAGKNNIEK